MVCQYSLISKSSQRVITIYICSFWHIKVRILKARNLVGFSVDHLFFICNDPSYSFKLNLNPSHRQHITCLMGIPTISKVDTYFILSLSGSFGYILAIHFSPRSSQREKHSGITFARDFMGSIAFFVFYLCSD